MPVVASAKKESPVMSRHATQRTPLLSKPAGASESAAVSEPTACSCGGGCPRCQKKASSQTKLPVSRPGDALEQEADRIANQVVCTSAPGAADSALPGHARREDAVMQRTALSTNAARPAQPTSQTPDESAAPAHVADYVTASRGAGRELPGGPRAFFESRFVRDFGGVRVHDDPAAAQAANSIGARAFTAGQDVYFARGEYGPDSTAGRNLLAHELVHTLQQSPGTDQGLASDGKAKARSATPTVIQRSPFVIEHSSGTNHEVPGLTAGETEFGASGSSSSLLTPAKPRAGRPITGGFKTDLDVDTGFATGVDTAASKDVDALIKSAGTKIDAKLLPAVRAVATDKFVLTALQTFLKTDGGSIVAWNNNSGKYDGDKSPPTLSIGIATGDLDLRSTLVHELLHYVFDKSDSILAESKDDGGADHPAIEAIEARYAIVSLIRSGKPPLDKKVEDAFGHFLKGDDFFPKMQDAIAKDDRKGLQAMVAQTEFVKQTVSSGLLGQASGLGLKLPGDHYNYNADQFRDLGFIWAQNAAIVRHAMKTAATVADKTKTPLKDVFATAEWQKVMNTFLDAFVKGLRKDRTKGVVSLEAKL